MAYAASSTLPGDSLAVLILVNPIHESGLKNGRVFAPDPTDVVSLVRAVAPCHLDAVSDDVVTAEDELDHMAYPEVRRFAA